jgi:imidazole glycerol phosphate synthase glutamine amidotransferase subunit
VNVAVIDYGAGNVTSVARALGKLGATVQLTNRGEEIRAAKCLILPGVGHCSALISALDAHELRQPLLDAIRGGAAFLGICLGLQVLYDGSDEASDLPGLGLFKGRVSLLPADVKLPHMGWNQVRVERSTSLLANIPTDAYFYFAHSYAAPATGREAAALCTHGRDFIAVLEQNNICGVQFHPEKSGAPGAKLLENFLRRAA